MKNTKFWNIQLLVINQEQDSQLLLENIEVSEIGTQQTYTKEDQKEFEYLKHFDNELISRNDPRFHKEGEE